MAAFTSTIRSRTDGYTSRSASRWQTIDVATSVSASLDPTELQLETSLDGITPIREFEPIVNVPAASAFLLIAVVFALLQLRINAVSAAAKRRSEALEVLRTVESLQLSDPKDRPDETKVAAAKREYEHALRDELNLRTIIPGVRIVAPNDPKRDEEQRAAAKRFLGWDSNEFGENDDVQDSGELLSGSEETSLSGGAQIVLFGVASTLLVLLWTLSFDPMSPPSGSIAF